MSRVGLFFGGRSAEHLVSVRSARTVRDGLRQAGHDVVLIGIDRNGCVADPAVAARVLDDDGATVPDVGGDVSASYARLLDAKLDVAFPIIHGTFGEDGTLQGLLAMLDVPCVGASVLASAAAMDKRVAKDLFRAAGVPVVESDVVSKVEFERDKAAVLHSLRARAFPRFVKPAMGGSSVGCRLAPTFAALDDALSFAFQFDDHALVERGVKARELEVAVLGHRALEASVVGEIVPGNEFYDYEDKYVTDGATLVAPAKIDDKLSDRLRTLAVKAFRALGGSGMARVDFFLEADGTVSLNEINTLPGFTSISMYPRLFALTGFPLDKLVDRLVADAILAHADRVSLMRNVAAFVGQAAASKENRD